MSGGGSAAEALRALAVRFWREYAAHHAQDKAPAALRAERRGFDWYLSEKVCPRQHGSFRSR